MLVRDRLSGVTAFLAAVEEGSFSAAADRLSLTRSAVSKTVSRLALQLPFLQVSESMGNHDSKIVDAASVD